MIIKIFAGKEVTCPTQGDITNDRSYIKSDNNTIQFPAIRLNCNTANTTLNLTNLPDPSKKAECKKYFLFDKIRDTSDDDDRMVRQDQTNKITLYDMCPNQCGETRCSSS